METSDNPLQDNRSPTNSYRAQPLSATQTAYLWTRMIARYGNRWTSQFGSLPAGTAMAEWAETCAGLDNAALTAGFAADVARGDDWPPSSPAFRALCEPRLEEPARRYGTDGSGALDAIRASKRPDSYYERPAYKAAAEKALAVVRKCIEDTKV